MDKEQSVITPETTVVRRVETLLALALIFLFLFFFRSTFRLEMRAVALTKDISATTLDERKLYITEGPIFAMFKSTGLKTATDSSILFIVGAGDLSYYKFKSHYYLYPREVVVRRDLSGLNLDELTGFDAVMGLVSDKGLFEALEEKGFKLSFRSNEGRTMVLFVKERASL